MVLPINVNDYLKEALLGHGIGITEYNGWLLVNNGLPAWRAFVVEINQHTDTTVAQLDFHILVDKQKEFIIESFAGFGDTYEQAVNSGLGLFLYNTFHVINGAFINSNDKQVTKEIWEIDGVDWDVILGNYSVRAKEPIVIPEELFNVVEKSIREKELTSNVHWLRVFYGGQVDAGFMAEALFDNDPWFKLQELIPSLDWQKSKHYYSVRNFLILRRRL
ncbi:MAG: hypothetical protein HY819_15520 [Acidobacteria bacterium]|nr:hypothetical protein [Acidobacteriota bacterium]